MDRTIGYEWIGVQDRVVRTRGQVWIGVEARDG
jgi:hypothetical protein